MAVEPSIILQIPAQAELPRLMAEIHADAVLQQLAVLNCSPHQKQQILNILIESTREQT